MEQNLNSATPSEEQIAAAKQGAFKSITLSEVMVTAVKLVVLGSVVGFAANWGGRKAAQSVLAKAKAESEAQAAAESQTV